MEKKLIELQLQSLRDKLYEVVEEKGSFTHPAVLAISEEADQLIVALQTMKIHGEQSEAAHCKSSSK
ncbi:Spo0E family sporulation regulatory protein-aspartic acid phosphatase [Paenibacillus septentrionalis]|uniref:Spo0E family sporulation regulatory protein-aspartic acid phosphatase n=1 Tax=Paenibacillus septentrionalis TaxID=429342 RepID=A0ABW1V878_9BACL